MDAMDALDAMDAMDVMDAIDAMGAVDAMDLRVIPLHEAGRQRPDGPGKPAHVGGEVGAALRRALLRRQLGEGELVLLTMRPTGLALLMVGAACGFLGG